MSTVWGIISFLVLIGLLLFLVDPEQAAHYYDWFIDRWNQVIFHSRNLGED